MSEGKVTLTCGHVNETPVHIWEPDIDRQGQRCRSYSTYCPACAENASLAMVEQIEGLEAKLTKALKALGAFADDTNWFDAAEEDGTFYPAWRGTGSPEEIASAAIAKVKGEE